MSSRSLRASVSGATAQEQQPVIKRSSANKKSSLVVDSKGETTTTDRLPNKKIVHRNSTMGLLGLFGRKNSKAEKQQQQQDRSLRSSPSFFTNPGDLAHYVPFYDPLLYSNLDETDNSISSSTGSINSLGKNRTPSGKSLKSANNSAIFLNPLASLMQLPLVPASKPAAVLLIADQLSLAGEVNGTGELESEAYRPYYDDDGSDYELGPPEATDYDDENGCHEEAADCCNSNSSKSDDSDPEPPPNPPMLNRQHCFRRKFHNSRTQSCHNFGQTDTKFGDDNQRRRTVNERLLMMRRIVSTPPDSDRETETDVDVASAGSTFDFLPLDDIDVFRPHQQRPADPCHIHSHLSQ